MREQIRRSVSNPDWVFAGRDNEHSPDNPPIMGLMDKFGAVRGTERDSAVLELSGLTEAMRGRWLAHVETQALPSHMNALEICPNNFVTRWSSSDGKQQIAVIFTKMASTFSGHPVVWTKIRSNGNLPKREMLQEVMGRLLATGHHEISDRKWGVPRDMQTDIANLSYALGQPVPVLHIHADKEPKIITALLDMGVTHRKFGHHTMLSGVIDVRNVRDQEAVFGQKLPTATTIQGIDPKQNMHRPQFEFAPRANALKAA